MASGRIAWLMAPPSLAALCRPSAQAVALSGQWPPMSRHPIVRYPTGLRQERDFMDCLARPLRPRSASSRISSATGSPALREHDLFPGSETVFLREGGRAVDDLPGVHRCEHGCRGSIRPSRSAPSAALRLPLLA